MQNNVAVVKVDWQAAGTIYVACDMAIRLLEGREPIDPEDTPFEKISFLASLTDARDTFQEITMNLRTMKTTDHATQ